MDTLDRLLQSDDPDEFLQAVQEIGPEDWTRNRLNTILDRAKKGDPFLLSLVAEQLETVPAELEPYGGQFLIDCLEHAEETVRSDAAESIGVLNYRPAHTDLAELLREDTSELVRTDVAIALGALALPASAPVLRNAAREDTSPQVRAAAATSLGQCLWDQAPADKNALWDAVQNEEEYPQVRIEWADGSITIIEDPTIDQQSTVYAYHPVDLDRDGRFTFFDISRMLTAYIAQDQDADFNDDGSINIMDIMEFIDRFNTPCP